jgi:hypothetical protein
LLEVEAELAEASDLQARTGAAVEDIMVDGYLLPVGLVVLVVAMITVQEPQVRIVVDREEQMG